VSIKWSSQARKDLKAIHAYIARDSQVYARGQIARIVERVEKVSHRPTVGHPVHEYPELPLREVHAGNYRIIYAFAEDQFHVLTVIHMKQQLPRHRLR
jgi:toxin ParE1/3/4